MKNNFDQFFKCYNLENMLLKIPFIPIILTFMYLFSLRHKKIQDKTSQSRTQLIFVTDNCSIYVCISKLRSFSKIIFLNVLFVIFHHWPGFINTVNNSSSIFFGELALKRNQNCFIQSFGNY